jgi:cysteine desulfurase/selenocysteine lyase
MNIKNIKSQFPIFQQQLNGYDFIYFDSASTAQVPDVVIAASSAFYESYKSNVGRGIYQHAETATLHYENARKTVANFIGADAREIVFTSGTTAAINMIAQSWARHNMQAGEEIIVSDAEHHSNVLPWLELAREKNLTVTVVPVNLQGVVDPETFEQYLSSKTRLVAIFYTSNLLGTTNDVAKITQLAHAAGARVLIDAAQAVAHRKILVKDIACDWLVFSGHKLFGPTGVGVLYSSANVYPEMQPSVLGGGMVFSLTAAGYSWKQAPACFEAGTPAIAQAVGLAQAVEWVTENVDFALLQRHETELVQRAGESLSAISSVVIVSHLPEPGESSNLITFYSTKVHAHDIAAHLDSSGIAVRAGNHCVQPYHEKRGVSATVRLSFSVYNTAAELDFCLKRLEEIL